MSDVKDKYPAITREQWKQQVIKDLRGGDFDEKLVKSVHGIAIQPLYIREDLPQGAPDPNREFFAEMEPAGADANLQPAWAGIEAHLVDQHTDLQALVTAMRARGIYDLRLSVQDDADWDGILDNFRKLQAPVHLHAQVDGLLDEHTAARWRERVGFLGDRDRLLQSLEFDPVSAWIRNGSSGDLKLQSKRLAEVFFRIGGHLQDCRLIKVDVSEMCVAGSSAVEQLSEALHRTALYLDLMEAEEVPLFELLPLMTVRFGLQTDYFVEMAKLRAWKVLWSNLCQLYLDEADFIPSCYLEADIVAHGFSASDAHANLLRSTTTAMSAILGGADAIHIPSYDQQNIGVSTLNTSANIHNLLRFESYMDMYREAAAGSYYIEDLTYTLGSNAWNTFIAGKEN